MGAAIGTASPAGYVTGETGKGGDFREEATLGPSLAGRTGIHHKYKAEGSRQRHGPIIKQGPFEDTPGVLGLAEAVRVPEPPAGQKPGQSSSQASPCQSSQEVETLPRSEESGGTVT